MVRLITVLFGVLSCCVLCLGQTSSPASTGRTAPSSGQLPPLQTTVTVTGNVSTATPASMMVVSQQQLQQTPGVNLDDRLRQVPGFSLFRRSSSLVANPTTQGVSLRAIGSTGASRTLVLWDGVPLNDPFGGWIYWTRVNPDFIDRVELVPGGNTAVFGYDAMGGAIALFSTSPQHQHLLASYFGGGENTQDLSGGYSNLWGRFGVSADVRAFRTDGYYIVPEPYRGSVDDQANVHFVTGTLNLDYLGDFDHLAIRLNTLAEERQNGTVLQTNSTSLGTLSTNYTHSWQHDEFAFIGYYSQEQFHSTYSAVAGDRDSERLTSKQTVPVEDIGGAAYWQHHASRWNTFVGMDTDDAHGISNDFSYSTMVLTRSGGTLLQHGIFGQADVQLGPARFYGGIRHQFTGQGDTFVSPNGGVTVGFKQFRFRASGYRSFRAPTLNELYRSFRVGNALTLANAGLVPEGLVGVESGVDWTGENDRLSLTLFRDDLSNLIVNATLNTTPNLILRQRQNQSSGLSRGIQTSYSHQWRNWNFDANYLYADARAFTGLRLPEIPKQQGTGGITYSRDSTLVSFGVRAFGLQFDDDLNQYPLPGYAALQIAAQQKLIHNLYAQVAIENLLDRQFLVAMTPTPNTGAPRLWRIGLRWNGSIH
jgi:outer membrane cobalamin receptor